MAPVSLPAAVATVPPSAEKVPSAVRESIWRAPLVPVALAGTAGIVLDRSADVPLPVSLLAVAAGLVGWWISRLGRSAGLPLLYLAGSVTALGAAYHQWYRNSYPADDIGRYATAEPQPVRLRGVLLEGFRQPAAVQHDPLRSLPRLATTRATLQARGLHTGDDWLSVSGQALLVVAGPLPELQVGEEVEVVGRLQAPPQPGNPGEFDYAAFLADRRIRAEVHVQKTPDAVKPIASRLPISFSRSLALVRAWGQQTLQEALPGQAGPLATALLLGETTALPSEEWDAYIRTGVIHVLAISGQHLVVLGLFLWALLWLLGVRRRRGAWLVASFLLLYALLTGGRPPVLRSAVTVGVVCGALILRRTALPANSFALAWLVVAALNPTDVFHTGCQLSFLAVATLYWGTSRWSDAEPDPLAELVEESRPAWQRGLLGIGRPVALAYGVTLAVWLGVTPLVAGRYHIVSPVGLLIGPPVTLLTSIALITGFLLLLAAAVCSPLVPLFAWPTARALAACQWLVESGDALPGGHWYVGTVPDWWLGAFYLALLAVLTQAPLRRHWRWAALAGVAWLCVGLVGGAARPAADELRCTFLAVGHGGCLVLESPDGRVLLYDAGAMAGPDVTQRQIAPFLWQRGIRRLDEIFLSHADLDHFNGLPALLPRFAVGQVTTTPTFQERPTAAVQHTLAALGRSRIPLRTVKAGDRLFAGPLEIEVLHPPAHGLEQGTENARSLVLRLCHEGHTLLLTGDLESPGLEQVLSLPRRPVDVLLAPHHGSRFSNRPELADWARPRVVVSCQGPPRGPVRTPNPYACRGAHYLTTWSEGAVTVCSRPGELIVETFRTGQRFHLGPREASARGETGSYERRLDSGSEPGRARARLPAVAPAEAPRGSQGLQALQILSAR